jgi:hypothetical protein
MAKKQFDVVVDIDQMTIGDLELLDDFRRKPEDVDMAQVNDLLDKVTPGTDVRKLPITSFSPLVEAITSAINMDATGQDESGEA